MSDVEFTNNSIQIKKAIREKAIAFLTEAAGEVQTAVHNASRVDTGETRGSYTYVVDESELEATVGSPEENAIWEEFGTGEYAVNGNGRKGGWYYEDKKGNGHFTHGKTPNRPLEKAFKATNGAIQNRANEIFGELK
jgi:hypothetical protein|uniref:Putative tail component n=1 Tax=Myoviridae sp. ctXVO17 TaxID=2825121 RepID=A0A8S5P3F9_9CAUD|nr:MAG TPA: putative tail component [Myoviridae sp. ctXVO17]DAY67987.1 MAG TPA: putative tail component [Caudoviricetes sp.]